MTERKRRTAPKRNSDTRKARKPVSRKGEVRSALNSAPQHAADADPVIPVSLRKAVDEPIDRTLPAGIRFGSLCDYCGFVESGAQHRATCPSLLPWYRRAWAAVRSVFA